MNVQRICFLGTRTPEFEATVAFFRDVVGLSGGPTEPGWSVFQLPSGRRDYLEVFGPEQQNASLIPNEVSEGVVVAFAVDDIVVAREELAAAGAELIGDLVWAADLFGSPTMEGFGWFFFRGPDGNVYAMQQDAQQATSELAVLSAFDALDVALAGTDPEAIVELFASDPDVTFWGSALAEQAVGRAELRALASVIAAAPGSFTVDWSERQVTIERDVAWVNAAGSATWDQGDGRVVVMPYRATGVLVRRTDAWLWHTFNGSEPQAG